MATKKAEQLRQCAGVYVGYAGLKPDHEKAVRSFGNSRDVLRACQPWMDSLNASKIAPESLCHWKRCFILGSSFLGDWNLQGRQIFATKCLRTLLSCATVAPHFTWCHNYITFLQALRQFLQSRGMKTEWPVHQTNFPCVTKNGLGTRLTTTIICLSFILKPNPPGAFVNIS